ncbi:hypothetical protein BATDEDRAFT_88139 [Batrachochytrium dendrobatidis JAM81]|uniref:C2H2-type domain-containing protein n=1 Tax=Batrachochytrium dendrobatidis (strain JAM81 / FGSC 10211) TaxID=684364 RepID=F4P283_BATDJ|nr:uncharacterized protein BATDEDRAFT_88139 [Batrachochytrium dendrobatidis JAM81]EGF81073.1 hypothetical protein BATDEDRAFT_88139 [Batrachochytrium dendrobatidis JAM81]|eukprot:XP_006678806.1 hypothetical protein BATDEDRAFT_88139 [Batrachochytrium dendrobatidis JAM81]
MHSTRSAQPLYFADTANQAEPPIFTNNLNLNAPVQRHENPQLHRPMSSNGHISASMYACGTGSSTCGSTFNYQVPPLPLPDQQQKQNQHGLRVSGPVVDDSCWISHSRHASSGHRPYYPQQHKYQHLDHSLANSSSSSQTPFQLGSQSASSPAVVYFLQQPSQSIPRQDYQALQYPNHTAYPAQKNEHGLSQQHQLIQNASMVDTQQVDVPASIPTIAPSLTISNSDGASSTQVDSKIDLTASGDFYSPQYLHVPNNMNYTRQLLHQNHHNNMRQSVADISQSGVYLSLDLFKPTTAESQPNTFELASNSSLPTATTPDIQNSISASTAYTSPQTIAMTCRKSPSGPTPSLSIFPQQSQSQHQSASLFYSILNRRHSLAIDTELGWPATCTVSSISAPELLSSPRILHPNMSMATGPQPGLYSQPLNTTDCDVIDRLILPMPVMGNIVTTTPSTSNSFTTLGTAISSKEDALAVSNGFKDCVNPIPTQRQSVLQPYRSISGLYALKEDAKIPDMRQTQSHSASIGHHNGAPNSMIDLLVDDHDQNKNAAWMDAAATNASFAHTSSQQGCPVSSKSPTRTPCIAESFEPSPNVQGYSMALYTLATADMNGSTLPFGVHVNPTTSTANAYPNSGNALSDTSCENRGSTVFGHTSIMSTDSSAQSWHQMMNINRTSPPQNLLKLSPSTCTVLSPPHFQQQQAHSSTKTDLHMLPPLPSLLTMPHSLPPLIKQGGVYGSDPSPQDINFDCVDLLGSTSYTKPVEKAKPASSSGVKRRYYCEFSGCDRWFTRKYNVDAHQRTHTGERPEVCPHCSKTFNRKHDLTRHVSCVHNKSLRYGPCNGCGARFPRQDAFKRHFFTCSRQVE